MVVKNELMLKTNSRTKTPKDYETFRSSEVYRKLNTNLEPILEKIELHQARAFNGHNDQKPKFEA